MRKDFYNTFWTFGNHEPLTMYRRLGRRSTGGCEGGALFLDEWHHWYDSEECVKAIAETGSNLLHCRFYKGMGWKFEEKDFPSVAAFAKRCRAHNIKVLAYVQYATLYYEMMSEEIPNLEDWAARDEHGGFYYYGDSSCYFRWMPCVNNPDFVDYEKKIVAIAANAGCFDGIMIDNAMASRCRCPRCLKLFREFLKKNYNPEDFGLPNFDFVRFPGEAALFPKNTDVDVKDPLIRAAFEFWAESNHAALKAICDHARKNHPGFIISGNASSPRRTEGFRFFGMAPGIYQDCFDLILCQCGNEPRPQDGALINRIRELMFFDVDKIPVNPLSDGDAGSAFLSPDLLLAQMLECRVWGGITGDRLVMVPKRADNLDLARRAERGKVNKRFLELSEQYRNCFESEEAATIGSFYSVSAHKWSFASQLSQLVWEEMLLRKHIPFRLVKSDGKNILGLDKCKVLILGGCRCLSEQEVLEICRFMDRGGTVIVEANAGDYDENNRLRAKNPFANTSVVVSAALDISGQLQTDWVTAIRQPENMEDVYIALKKILETEYSISAAEFVRCRLVNATGGKILHFINYSGVAVPLPKVCYQGKMLDLKWITEQGEEDTSKTFKSWCMAKLG